VTLGINDVSHSLKLTRRR